MIDSSSNSKYFDINKLVMRCCTESHEMQRLKYLCIDPCCAFTSKLGCADCFLDSHLGHRKLLVENFVEKL